MLHRTWISLDRRYELIASAREQPAYFSTGERVYLAGARLPFPQVYSASATRAYSWDTVDRVLSGNRVFRI